MEELSKEREDTEVLWSLLSKEAERLNQMKLCEKFEVQYYERQANLSEATLIQDIDDSNVGLSYPDILDIKDDLQKKEDKTTLYQALSEEAERLRQLKISEKCETQHYERQAAKTASSVIESNQNDFDRDPHNKQKEEERIGHNAVLQVKVEMGQEGKEEEEQMNCYQEDGKEGTEKDDDDQNGNNTNEPPVTEVTAELHSGIVDSSVEIKDGTLEEQDEKEEKSFQSVGIQTENSNNTSEDEHSKKVVEHLRKDVKENETQTDPPTMASTDRDLTKVAASLGLDSELLKTMREERSKRLVMEQMVKIVESEANEQRYQLLAEKNRADKLEMDLIDTKAELSHTTSLAVEYKTRVFDLEDSLQGARKMITNLEGKLSGTEYFKGGVDYMLENKLAQTRTTEAEKKLHGVQEELLLARNEINRLLEKLSEVNREKSEMVSSTVHLELLRIADERAAQAEKKAMELEKQLHDTKKAPQQTVSSSPIQSPVKLPEIVPRPSRAHTVSGLMSIPELPDFSATKPDVTRVLPSLPQTTGRQVTPLLANENSDSEGWSSEEETPKPVRAWDSPKSTSKGPLHTRIGVKLPVPAFLQNRQGARIPGSPDKGIGKERSKKPPVPAKPMVAPKPTKMTSPSPQQQTTVAPSPKTKQDQQVEPPSSFEKNLSNGKLVERSV
uniref:Uncharacterized protein n=1 Tax=Branchiostoma floridae TaxID=7739 RepID=C3Y2H4_BRAFL|eukprot:XP_002609519.1 hypothetical protein BRAFLDRAFT_127658 [Branchiostoma floridae]